MNNKLVNVIGLGYIGLPTAALLASRGYQVLGTDINGVTVETINKGKIHIVEDGLDSVVNAAVTSGRLKASSLHDSADVYIICVPTPFHDAGDIPQPNIDLVIDATRAIAPFIKSGNLVILESTSPVGTTEKIGETLRDAGVNTNDIHIAYCPERVLPGRIMVELIENDRVVGGLTSECTKVAADFYRTFVSGEVLETDAKTAEMCKLTENSFRDVNIAFANELSLICDKEGINVWSLIGLANRHPRVNILQPGPGVGGHCIAVDPWFIVSRDVKNSRLIRTARTVNDSKIDWVVNKIMTTASELTLKLGRQPIIACFGLSFKPDIDDLRESPALRIFRNLLAREYNVIAVEPNIQSLEGLQVFEIKEALLKADLIVVLVKHRQFIQGEIARNLTDKVVLDFCGCLVN